MKITIVVPCYNEEEVLIDTTQQLTAVVKQLESAFELKADVLYVDDGSKDATWEMIQKFAAEDTHIHGLKLAHNVGHQRALWAGLDVAAKSADAMVSIDADLQDDVAVIEKMVARFLDGNDIVYGATGLLTLFSKNGRRWLSTNSCVCWAVMFCIIMRIFA